VGETFQATASLGYGGPIEPKEPPSLADQYARTSIKPSSAGKYKGLFARGSREDKIEAMLNNAVKE